MDAVPWMDFLDRDFKFSTLRSEFSSTARLPLQKCCEYNEFFSFVDKECISINCSSTFSPTKQDPRPNSNEFEIKYGSLGCANANLTRVYSYFSAAMKIDKFFENGSLNALFTRNKKPVHFELGEYCFDIEKEMLRPLVLTCQPAETVGNGSGWFTFIYYVSIVLMIIAFSLHLVIPELRKRVYDKCFACFMSFAILALLLIVLRTTETGLEKRGIKFRYISLICIYYIAMVSYCWLQAMCFHLWRTVTTTKAILGRSFYGYALYAVGIPVICCSAFFLDLSFNGWEPFLYRCYQGDFISDPVLLYFLHIGAVQHIINSCLFIHVGYLIWYQKQPWNEDSCTGGQKHVGQQKTLISRLIRLSVLMGMDWMNIFLLNYVKSETNMNNIFYLLYHINLCPGYVIFITFVCCNEQVIHPLKQKYPGIMRVASFAIKILFGFTLSIFIYFVVDNWGKQGQNIFLL